MSTVEVGTPTVIQQIEGEDIICFNLQCGLPHVKLTNGSTISVPQCEIEAVKSFMEELHRKQMEG